MEEAKAIAALALFEDVFFNLTGRGLDEDDDE